MGIGYDYTEQQVIVFVAQNICSVEVLDGVTFISTVDGDTHKTSLPLKTVVEMLRDKGVYTIEVTK